MPMTVAGLPADRIPSTHRSTQIVPGEALHH